MSVPFVDLRKQYLSLEDEINSVVHEVLRSSKYILGDYVCTFERQMEAYCGVRHAIGLNSGTDALFLALKAAGIGPGDEVITVSHTFFATAEAIIFTGATPVFVDVVEATCLMDPLLLAAAITPRTRAIVPVHLYGQVADMDAILAQARQHDLVVVEDACQSIGAAYQGKKAGTIGDLGCFSFVPAKNLGGYGDGGMVVTNNDDLAQRIRVYRDHGSQQKYRHKVVGYNSRLDAIQAAILSVKLRNLDQWNSARRGRASQYDQLLQGCNVITPQVGLERSHVYHLYVVRHPERARLMEHLSRLGIVTLIHYPIPIHRQEAWGDRSPVTLPVTERITAEILSLPMFPEMTVAQVEEVVDAIATFERSH